MINTEYGNIPQELKQVNNWICYVTETKKGSDRRNKPPINPLTGGHARLNDPNTWASYEDMLKCSDKFEGPGFVFTGSPFVGIDLDDCIEDGRPNDWAQKIIDHFKSRTELSVSGTGVHIYVKGKIPTQKNYTKPYEIKQKGAYFTVTGVTIQGLDTIEDRQNELESAIADIEKSRGKKKKISSHEPQEKSAPASFTCSQLIEKIKQSRYNALFDGDYSCYLKDDGTPDHSRADLALMNALAFYTGGNTDLMEQIYKESGLYETLQRPGHEADYIARTINTALKSWNGTAYDPKYQKGKLVNKTAGELAKLTKFPWTDDGNAERLQYLYGDSLLYCIPYKKWFKYDGLRWKISDEIDIYEAAKNTARLTLDEVIDQYDSADLEKTKQKLIRACRSMENMRGKLGMIRVARSLMLIEPEEMDSDPWLLNCQNGILNLKTFELMPHDKSYKVSKICRASYLPKNDLNLWTQTVEQIIPDKETRHFMQKFVGYCLTGSVREEKFLFLYGPGGGGKGTFIETIGEMLGDYADSIPIDVLLTARNDAKSGNEPTPELAKLAGVRLVITSESGKGRKFNDARIKLITGGDRITARQLRSNPFTFKPTHKLVAESNHMPSVTDVTDKGMKRRLMIIPFTSDLEDIRNVKLKETLSSPENLASVLAWCVEGCRMWQKEGFGEVPHEMAKMMADYYTDNDLIGEFIQERCAVNPDSRVGARDLLRSYNLWADDGRRYHGTDIKTFTSDLINRGFEKRRFSEGMCFVGLDYKQLEDNMEIFK